MKEWDVFSLWLVVEGVWVFTSPEVAPRNVAPRPPGATVQLASLSYWLLILQVQTEMIANGWYVYTLKNE